jgi:hypothetical protein
MKPVRVTAQALIRITRLLQAAAMRNGLPHSTPPANVFRRLRRMRWWCH